MALLGIEDPSARKQGKTALGVHPLLALGFRPFYLLAAAFAAVSVPVWLAKYYGGAAGLAHVDMFWHMHEMVFGFVIAVIIGFLYTAGRNWSGLWTPRGGTLAAIGLLWIAGRVAMCTAAPPLAAAIDFVFIPVAAWPLYRVLKRAGNKRNLVLVVLLSLLAAANAVFHAARIGWLDISPLPAVQAAIIIVVIIETMIGGRVIPGFTANAVPGVKPVTNEKRDRVMVVLTVGAGLAWVCGAPAVLSAALAVGAAIAQAIRLLGWKPFRTVHNPLLWILHASYAWIPLGLLLLGLAALGIVSDSAAFHALAVGSTAGLILGMITRTALGHTGRALKAGPSETVMYALIQVGAIARLVAAIDTDGLRNAALVLAAVCWSSAFVLYLAVYGPYLFRARVDGREG